MMKRIIAVFAAILMLLSFVSCGAKEAVNNIVEDVVQEVSEQSNKKITRGVIEGNVYTNDYSDLTFTATDGWSYSTDEDLAAVMNIGKEQFAANDISKNLAELGTVYDMMVNHTDTGSNFMVMYENMDVTNLGRDADENKYLDILKENLSKQSGISYELMNQDTVTFGENDYLKASFSVTVDTVEISQVYYLRSIDNVMCCMIATPVNGVVIEDIEAMIS
ncbi:MAG: hypothetical protein IKU52_03155 [Clostridia bacterium]|nr:hypothetical protein [Clostridia bacterium]